MLKIFNGIYQIQIFSTYLYSNVWKFCFAAISDILKSALWIATTEVVVIY